VLVAAGAGRDIRVDPDELHAVVRRALLLHAAGGDALRSFELDDRSVRAVAADLDSDDRRAALARGLDELGRASAGFPHLRRVVGTVTADPELAWRAWACAVLLEWLEDDR